MRSYPGYHQGRLSFLADPDVLKETLENNRFKLYLQSKIDVQTRTVVGAEALIRYRDESGSMIGPDQYIPVLEDTCLISKINYYVFEAVCKTLSAWLQQGKSVLPVSSNF